MNILQEVHQAHFFTDNSDVEAGPRINLAISQALASLNMMGNIGHEVNAATGVRRKFPVMVTLDEKLRVEFPSNEIIIISRDVSTVIFQDQLERILDALANVFPSKNSNRISILHTKVFSATNDVYNEVYKKLFTYHQELPFEWENRIASRKPLATSKEVINSISSIRRCEVLSHISPNIAATDSLIFELDSNTIPQNSTMRLNLLNSKNIYKELIENNSIISKSLERYTNI